MLEATLFIIVGLVVAVLTIKKPNFFWEHKKARRLRRIIGDRATTVLYLAIALALIGSGVISWFGNSKRVELDKIASVYERGELDQAIVELDSYLEQYPDDSLAWTLLGEAHADLGQYEQAETAFLRAISVDEPVPQAYTNFGILMRKLEEYDRAAQYYGQAIELDPDYAEAYSSLAVIELIRYQDQRALSLAEKAFELNENEPVIAANLAVVYFYNNMSEKQDRMIEIAKKLGYDVDKLAPFFEGEMTIRD